MSLKFINDRDTVQAAATYLEETIRRRLQDSESVLWIVSGGSNIAVAVAAAAQLRDIDSGTLTIMLAHERFGPVGHPDSNWQQLIEAGFDLPHAQLLPTLSGHHLHETMTDYQTHLSDQFLLSSYKIGLFGMGADGHTAGILPGSEAAGSNELVSGYEGPDATRITMTPQAIKQLDEVVLVACGEAKWPQLARLAESLPEIEQPVQALKLAASLRIYSDQTDMTWENDSLKARPIHSPDK